MTNVTIVDPLLQPKGDRGTRHYIQSMVGFFSTSLTVVVPTPEFIVSSSSYHVIIHQRMGVWYCRWKTFDVQAETGQVLSCNRDGIDNFMVVC